MCKYKFDYKTQLYCIYSKKKKKKPQSKKKEDTDESSDVDDGGWMRQREANLANLQRGMQEAPDGTQQEEGPSKETVEDEDKMME